MSVLDGTRSEVVKAINNSTAKPILSLCDHTDGLSSGIGRVHLSIQNISSTAATDAQKLEIYETVERALKDKGYSVLSSPLL